MAVYSSYAGLFDNVASNPGQIIYFCVDSPKMLRPNGITHFIGVQLEPNAISHKRDEFIQNHTRFDTILTFDEEILKECKNARMYVYGTSWIPQDIFNNIDTSIKKPCISSLTGWKGWAPGHQFRHILYLEQLTIPLPITWYRSGAEPIIQEIGNNPILTKDCHTGKPPMFLGYQFSLVIENSRQANYFTEKLMDCLLTKTIPIYYGCPNIRNWFDTTGWIILESESVEELISKCTVLPDYNALMPFINDNHERAKKYISFEKNICDVIGFKYTAPMKN
jgi:hypothetical protein